MVHIDCVSNETIEVEHFDPRRINGEKDHRYENLVPAFGPCNRSKSNKCPSPDEEAAGLRFLNPTVERDYGVHLFEDPTSHKIVAITPAGRYHLRHLNLNSEYLRLKREDRSKAINLKRVIELVRSVSNQKAQELEELIRRGESAIQEIPPPPPRST
jgi:hypothetical protein